MHRKKAYLQSSLYSYIITKITFQIITIGEHETLAIGQILGKLDLEINYSNCRDSSLKWNIDLETIWNLPFFNYFVSHVFCSGNTKLPVTSPFFPLSSLYWLLQLYSWLERPKENSCQKVISILSQVL